MAPEPLNDLTPENAASATNFPTLIPSANPLIRRTHTTLGLLRDVVQESSAEYWFGCGRAAEAVEQWAEAAYDYKQCMERKANYWRGAVRLAAALGHLGQAEAAAGALTEASEAAWQGWYDLSVELDTSDWKMLRDCLEAARSTARDGFGLLLGLALVYRGLGQYDKTCQTQARQILDVMQFVHQQQVAESAQWFCLSGNLHSEADASLDVKAFTDYDQAIELRPDYDSAYFNRGLVKARAQDYAGAIADYNLTIELNPDYVDAYFHRGLAKKELQDYNEYGLRDYTETFVDYNRAIELEPSHDTAYTYIAFLKERLNDYTGAIIAYDRVIQLVPGEANGYFFRGALKNKLRDYAGAITDYDQALELRPNLVGYRERATLQAKLGNTAGSEADRKKAAQLESKMYL